MSWPSYGSAPGPRLGAIICIEEIHPSTRYGMGLEQALRTGAPLTGPREFGGSEVSGGRGRDNYAMQMEGVHGELPITRLPAARTTLGNGVIPKNLVCAETAGNSLSPLFG
jgi:hypothetical protein